MSISAILFDLDDTLYLERRFVFSGFRSVAVVLEEEYGVEQERVWHKMVELFEQGARRQGFDHTLLQIGMNPQRQLISDLVEVYRHHRPCISLADDAISVLQWASGNYELGLITDGYGPMQHNKVDALGLQPWMEVIIYSDDLGREHWKPSPLPFQEALCSIQAQPTEAIYVADNPHKDFLGARSLGMGTVRIRRAGGLHVDTTLDSRHEADHDIFSLMDLVPLLTTDRQKQGKEGRREKVEKAGR